MKLEIKRALAIRAWDVFVNGKHVERFDKKYQAESFVERMKAEYGMLMAA